MNTHFITILFLEEVGHLHLLGFTGLAAIKMIFMNSTCQSLYFMIIIQANIRGTNSSELGITNYCRFDLATCTYYFDRKQHRNKNQSYTGFCTFYMRGSLYVKNFLHVNAHLFHFNQGYKIQNAVIIYMTLDLNKPIPMDEWIHMCSSPIKYLITWCLIH